MARILFVDDQKLIREKIRAILSRAGHDVTVAASGKEAVFQEVEQPFDVVITDLIMKDGDGFDVITKIRKLAPETVIIAMSGGSSAASEQGYDLLEVARQVGADLSLSKGCSGHELIATIDRLLTERPAEASS